MSTADLFFYLFAGLAIGFSLLTVFKKNPATSAFCLVMVFFSFAGVYALLDAHLLATLQVLVYAGAIMVLFIFVIMLLGADSPVLDISKNSKVFQAAVLALSGLAIAFFVYIFKESSVSQVKSGAFTPEFIAQQGGNTRVISILMFTEYLLPFELTSVLLLAGIVGAVAVAKRKRRGGAST